MTANEFNKISTMFENELHGNLIRKMRNFISYEITAANKTIKSSGTMSRKVEQVEMYSDRIGAILDCMFSSDILNIETYMSEYDRLISWKERKISEIYKG